MTNALVVIPTYLEAANIETVLERVRAAVPDAHILVVDDSSPDGTAGIAESVGERIGLVDVLVRPTKTGLGDAYRAGMAWGLAHGFDVLVSMDADLSHDPAALPDLLGACAAGADLVVGSRYIPGARIETSWPRRRRALSRWANRYVRVALRSHVADNTAGFRAYRATLLNDIRLANSRADGYAFQIETVYRALSIDAAIREVPIVFTDRAAGHSKLSGRTIVEALVLVTWWGVRARLGRAAVELDPARTPG
ncbi:MAG TPA: polyprenol monophosphomannose synthase [Acidimicrobiales bacterium]|nr:polyprenol monophosphomannose synthase [Acidimicrobiales bacterium]